jgi:hypothetical protein
MPAPTRGFWWLERVLVWLEVDLKPWRLDGYPADTDDQGVLQFWYGCLTDFLDARAKVQAKLRADPELAKSRDLALSQVDPYTDTEDAVNYNDPEGEW